MPRTTQKVNIEIDVDVLFSINEGQRQTMTDPGIYAYIEDIEISISKAEIDRITKEMNDDPFSFIDEDEIFDELGGIL